MILSCNSKEHHTENLFHNNKNEKKNVIDSLTAVEYGADEYGMKKYVMAFLKRGPNRSMDSPKRMELQMAHLENIAKMAEAGKLVLAGPFFDDGDLRGIYIFNFESLEEAEKLTSTDRLFNKGV